MSNVEAFEAGFIHRPQGVSTHALAITHGASSNCNSKLLLAIADAFVSAGFLVYRYDLPFRRARASGSPHPSKAAADRDGIRQAIASLRTLVSGRVYAGGHSYGGRQTTMAASEDSSLADGLLLFSYPLHPPGKPDQLRTAHFPDLRTPALFVHGDRDPFGSLEEMHTALRLIPATHQLFAVEKAGHDLGRKHTELAGSIVSRLV
ncbi:MAG: dienelactone hydrolase family protein [Acidobacteriaceae bacterium]|nr:dienelactone hydrolase family protein [Acidobacteriaceae bacterium]